MGLQLQRFFAQFFFSHLFTVENPLLFPLFFSFSYWLTSQQQQQQHADVFKILLRDNEPWNSNKNSYAPFLQTAPLRKKFFKNNKFNAAKIVKQMRDQIGKNS